ncbi:MAG: IS1380 family transposase [Candidatus Dormibacteria bacterium]
MQSSSHTLDRLQVSFDDPHLVANAGLLLPATLAQQLGLRELVEYHVDLGQAPGRANVGPKAMTLVQSMLAGGDSIDDADVLRAGATRTVLGHAVLAPSTLGTFLRSFTFGHVRQLDAVSRDALVRAWSAGMSPGDQPLTIDLDSTICETYGLAKQGVGFGYTKVRGYHPLLATRAETGEVLHSRLRGGSAHTARGAVGFLRETFARVVEAGASGLITLRADSGFYSQKVLTTCRRAGVRFSITAQLDQAVQRVIAAIPEDAWQPIPYWSTSGGTFGYDDQGLPVSGADVAECQYTAFGKWGLHLRLIVRRVRPTPGTQLALFTEFSYHPFATDREGSTLDLEADHRAHAQVETAIRDLKEGSGLAHLPSGRFAANAAWLALATLAHNLARWVTGLGLPDQLAARTTADRLRRCLFSIPGRRTRSARKVHLHLPQGWPWATLFLNALGRLRLLT